MHFAAARRLLKLLCWPPMVAESHNVPWGLVTSYLKSFLSTTISTLIFVQPRAACAWFLKLLWFVCWYVCMSVCPPPRALITSDMVWCDVGSVKLVKQMSQPFPAFNYFI